MVKKYPYRFVRIVQVPTTGRILAAFGEDELEEAESFAAEKGGKVALVPFAWALGQVVNESDF